MTQCDIISFSISHGGSNDCASCGKCMNDLYWICDLFSSLFILIQKFCEHSSSFSKYSSNQGPRILGAVSIRKTVLPGMAIPMLKIRRPNGHLIFNMGIPIPGKDGLYIETGPWRAGQGVGGSIIFTWWQWFHRWTTFGLSRLAAGKKWTERVEKVVKFGAWQNSHLLKGFNFQPFISRI